MLEQPFINLEYNTIDLNIKNTNISFLNLKNVVEKSFEDKCKDLNFNLKRNRKSLVIFGGDDHFGANLKLTNDKYVYTPEIYAETIKNFLHRLEVTGIDFNWYNGQIEELVYINHGDCIEGVAIHKNQAYNLHPDYQTASKQSEGVIKYGFKPILDWGINKFGKARCTVCIGNHETNGYDKSETDMKTFDIVKDLKHLGYDVSCDEIEEFWHYTDIQGFGSMATHGSQLSKADGYQNILVTNMRSMKIKYPNATMFSCGHWHSAVAQKTIESNGGLKQLDFWRTGSPKQGDRFGAKVSKGARPKRDWFAVVVCENVGVIESRGFRMELT